MGLVKEELNRMRQGGGGELHEWRRRECRIIGGGRGERELYRLGEEGMGIVQNGGGCGLSPRPGNGNISGEVTRVYL